jgi:hypothetical protein
MGNGAFMRLLTVSQNDYIFHRLSDYRIAALLLMYVAARRLIMQSSGESLVQAIFIGG